MTDPLYLADITVAAPDERVTVTGLPGGTSAEVPRGRILILPSHESEPSEEIFVPKKPTRPIRTYLLVDEPLVRLDDLAIDQLPADEPVVVAIAPTAEIDLGNFHDLAAQVHEHRRRLVITVGTLDA